MKTINVIEIANNDILGIRSFENTPKGREDAVAVFREIASENGVTEEDLSLHLESGYFEEGDYTLYLKESS